MISAGKHYSPRSRYHQVRVRVLSYRWGSCYPHSKTASRSTSRGCFLFQLPSLHRAGLPRKNRGAGLARIRIWGGRQGRSYHNCETCAIKRKGQGGDNKAAPINVIPHSNMRRFFVNQTPRFRGKIACNRFCRAGWYSLT